MKRITLLGTAFVVGLLAVGLAVAGANRNWSTHANGAMEVPVRDTQGQGQAIFQLAKDGESIDYKLIASNIENVFMAHIHMSQGPGTNGGIVVWLYPSTTPGVTAPLASGRTDGVLVQGTITEDDLVGALAGQPLQALIDAMNGGTTYANFHTNDGVDPANTGPGDFPGGEIRGDIE
jgi:CHRD domain